ncbi:MFS transporter [Pseudomonas eucalypticola]|uniref:MFS transporter n=1 Tax=Pseudomonas eucalypticola TaxID=2599595 RepID=A0A7D5D705_9PSED|nr:MFS transporter [Pseudomonas eucalypticola]QKZ04378.1 MFS transporter [Pseudomonas eucalypticola]
MFAIPRRTARWVQVATCLGFFMVLMDISVVNVALQALHEELSADITALQWVVNGYALVFASLLLTAGTLGDRLGAKRLFMLGFGLFSAASLGCALAPGLAALVGWRLVQGLGAALLVPTSLSLLQQAFDNDHERSRAVGWWGAGGAVALAAGPVVGGLLITAFGWRSLFFINVPVGMIGLWLAASYAPRSPVQPLRSLDIPGQCLAALTMASFTFALTQASQWGWSSPMIVQALIGSLLLAALFIWRQSRAARPMLPLGLFRAAALRSAVVIGLVANLVFYGVVFTLSLYFQGIEQFTPEQAGLAFLPMMAVLMLINILAGRLTRRVGPRCLATSGLLISAVGYLLLIPALAMPGFGWLIVPMLLAGGGIALTIPTITTATLASVPGELAGIASGLLNAARQVGGIIGVAWFGYLVRDPAPQAFRLGLREALFVAVATLLLAAVAAFRGLPAATGGERAPLARATTGSTG